MVPTPKENIHINLFFRNPVILRGNRPASLAALQNAQKYHYPVPHSRAGARPGPAMNEISTQIMGVETGRDRLWRKNGKICLPGAPGGVPDLCFGGRSCPSSSLSQTVYYYWRGGIFQSDGLTEGIILNRIFKKIQGRKNLSGKKIP